MNPNAALVIIGNEILSGRTLDTNTQTIALFLEKLGIRLLETRTIPDDRRVIIDSVKALSSTYRYVFTTGGIGPTHDDITTEAIAGAFEAPYVINQEAKTMISDYYTARGETLNEAREKMAYIPEGASLILNHISGAPGFVIKNVFVLPGVPNIMRAMLANVEQMLERGNVIVTKQIDTDIRESLLAAAFEDLQNEYPMVQMGSYPFEKNGEYGTSLVLRSSDISSLEEAFIKLKSIVLK